MYPEFGAHSQRHAGNRFSVRVHRRIEERPTPKKGFRYRTHRRPGRHVLPFRQLYQLREGFHLGEFEQLLRHYGHLILNVNIHRVRGVRFSEIFGRDHRAQQRLGARIPFAKCSEIHDLGANLAPHPLDDSAGNRCFTHASFAFFQVSRRRSDH